MSARLERAAAGLAAFLLIVWVGLCLSQAFGHEGEDQLSTWYRSLQTPEGGSCCNMHDCHPTDAKLAQGRWQVLIDGKWLEVPEKAVLKRENVAGEAVVCIWPPGQIRCFIPPSET